jgi:phospholipase C
MSSTGTPEQGRCGLGPRLPFLVVSPFAQHNEVSNTLIDQSSVVRFVEYNWSLAAMGNGAADQSAGALASMFNFRFPGNEPLFLNPTTGEPAECAWICDQ